MLVLYFIFLANILRLIYDFVKKRQKDAAASMIYLIVRVRTKLGPEIYINQEVLDVHSKRKGNRN